jgi:hypothetical protein
MFDSPALDVVIGLIFIFLLYSLLVTIVSEAVSTIFNIRGRMLLKSIERMLTDDITSRIGYRWYHHLENGIKSVLFKKSIHFKHSLAERFYQYPAIKYLSQHVLHKHPAYISTPNFSTSLIEILRRKGTASTIMEEIANGLHSPALANSPETRKQLEDLINKANGDVNVFKKSLELWFDETMGRASAWYKTNMQVMQLLIGLVLAISFNVNTFKIVKILAKDEAARENMVKMAMDPERNARFKAIIDSTQERKKKSESDSIDSVSVVSDTLYVNTYKRLQEDSKSVTNILGNGWGLRDSLRVVQYTVRDSSTVADIKSLTSKMDPSTIRYLDTLYSSKKIYLHDAPPSIKRKLKSAVDGLKEVDSIEFVVSPAEKTLGEVIVYGRAPLSIGNKIGIVFGSLADGFNFIGFLVTALALSLGAPFWFDLLNKFVAIKSAGKNPDAKKAEFPETAASTNALGHQLSEHVMKDPVRYAMALHSFQIRSIPGVITLNKDFIQSKKGVKTPCVEVTVLKHCDTSLIPKELKATFNGKEVTIPVEIVTSEIAEAHEGTEGSKFKMEKVGLRNAFKPEDKENWGTATGLVKLVETKEPVILSCAHVLQGNNRVNAITATTDIVGLPKNEVVAKLLYHYRSSAFDIGWAHTRTGKKVLSADYVKELTKITKPRNITDDDASEELRVVMKGLVSGQVEGFIWNNCVEYEFFYGSDRVKMFNLLKLCRRDETTKDLVTLSQSGDSGSLITDKRGVPVGLVIGGTAQFTFALKLTEVFDRFTEITYYES